MLAGGTTYPRSCYCERFHSILHLFHHWNAYCSVDDVIGEVVLEINMVELC